MVLDAGEVRELDSPRNLMAFKGAFYEMVQQTGAQNVELFERL